MKICRNTFDKSVELAAWYYEGDEPPLVKADPSQIEQVFLNLLINGMHAMTIMRGAEEKPGGVLSVHVDRIDAGPEFCRFYPDAREGKYWRVQINDTGVGMNQDTMARIFDPFFTTKDSDSGSGLGLAMVYSIIRQHGGIIDTYSMPGRGSTFNIFLPGMDPEEDEGVIVKTEDEAVEGEGPHHGG